jgi:branched-chain amino acid transport system ATP-binding protein
MLAIARTLMGNPVLLLLDEPSEGLAPRVVQAMAGHILRLKREGMTILLSEQNLHFATRVSDRAYVLEKGRIQCEGQMADLAADTEVLRRHLMV